MTLPKQADRSSPVAAAAGWSFLDVYRAHASQVARWATRLLGGNGDAEDVVQETFLVVSRKLSKVRDDGDLSSWLFQITRKVVANHRRRMRWQRLWCSGEKLDRIGADRPGPDAELERRRNMMLFQQAIDRLSEKQRTVFVLYELEGLATPAIAQLLQRNLSTVKVQLARARQRFVADYSRLLRQQCAHDRGGLPEIAQRALGADQFAQPRPGRKMP